MIPWLDEISQTISEKVGSPSGKIHLTNYCQ